MYNPYSVCSIKPKPGANLASAFGMVQTKQPYWFQRYQYKVPRLSKRDGRLMSPLEHSVWGDWEYHTEAPKLNLCGRFERLVY